MSESRKRRNESISLCEKNAESPTDDGVTLDHNDDNEDDDDNDDNVVIEVGIEDDQHGYNDETNNGENEDDDDDEGEDDSNEDEDYKGDEDKECDYKYDSDEDIDVEEDDDEDEEGERDYDDFVNDNTLQRAMRRNELPNIIFPLIEAYMKTMQQEQEDNKCGELQENKWGGLLLHLACSNCRSIVVLKLIELFPESVQQEDEHGDYPLHIACAYQPYDVVMTLIELFPMAVKHLSTKIYISNIQPRLYGIKRYPV